MSKLSNCCRSWKEITGNIEVVPTQMANPEEFYKAKCLQQLMLHFMGKFCPICGTRVEPLTGATGGGESK